MTPDLMAHAFTFAPDLKDYLWVDKEDRTALIQLVREFVAANVPKRSYKFKSNKKHELFRDRWADIDSVHTKYALWDMLMECWVSLCPPLLRATLNFEDVGKHRWSVNEIKNGLEAHHDMQSSAEKVMICRNVPGTRRVKVSKVPVVVPGVTFTLHFGRDKSVWLDIPIADRTVKLDPGSAYAFLGYAFAHGTEVRRQSTKRFTRQTRLSGRYSLVLFVPAKKEAVRYFDTYVRSNFPEHYHDTYSTDFDP